MDNIIHLSHLLYIPVVDLFSMTLSRALLSIYSIFLLASSSAFLMMFYFSW